MKIYQGATYKIPTQIEIDNKILNIDDTKKIEFAFGEDLIKTYPSKNKDIERSGNKLIVFLSSDDTLSLPADKVLRVQSRITFDDGSVKFTKSEPIAIVSTQFSKSGGEIFDDWNCKT